MIISKNIPYVRWSALALIALGAVYVGLIAWGMATQDPVTGFIRDPIRILMEIVTMISAIALLFFAQSIKNFLAREQRFLADTSVVFMALLVALTSMVHFASITISSQIVGENPLLAPLLSLNWPSLLLSIDILAWDVFFGIAFICLGLSLRPITGGAVTSIVMIVSGILSLLGLIALPLNDMNIRFIGIFGYTVMPVIACVRLLRDMNRLKRTP